MRLLRFGMVSLALVLLTVAAPGQDTSPNTSTTAKKRARARVAKPATQTIPLETAPPSPPAAPASVEAQKAADQHVLQQQQAQSAQAAQLTNQQVQAAQKQKDSIQNEVRIQDAPGPTQTGVVPASGPPGAPAATGQRIQDAPGPAQTLPVPAPAQPAQPMQPIPAPAANPPQ